MSPLLSQLSDVSEKDRRGKVSLNISLFEWLYFAGEDVLEAQGHAVLLLDSFGDHVKGE